MARPSDPRLVADRARRAPGAQHHGCQRSRDSVDVESFCIRSDLPNAPQFARIVRAVVDQARAER
uniref:hypothetical protein n=1 Tax=Agromyces bauzanensis TaxID=1308924 RepID=UPI0035712419